MIIYIRGLYRHWAKYYKATIYVGTGQNIIKPLIMKLKPLQILGI